MTSPVCTSDFISYYSRLTNFVQAILASGFLNRLCTWCSLQMECLFPRHLRISPLQISSSLLDLLQPFKTATASHLYCLFPHSLIFLFKTYQHRNTVQVSILFMVQFFPLEHGLANFSYTKYFNLCGPCVLCCNYSTSLGKKKVI